MRSFGAANRAGASSTASFARQQHRRCNKTLILPAAPSNFSSPMVVPSPDCRTTPSPAQRLSPVRALQHQSTVNATSSAAAVTPEIIALAHELADAAAAVTCRYFRTPVPVDVKIDASPVTIADREAEEAMRALITSTCPTHAIFGEEWGYEPGSSGDADADFLWVIDPIDGTKSFITGKPVFGTLVALLHRGRPVLGIIDQPIIKERWMGVAGSVTTLNGVEISTRSCLDVGAAYLYATTPHMFAGASEEAFNRLRDAVRIPLYGCDCYAYGLLAAGHCDIVAEADLKPYDYMALIPVIQGAGGTVTDWRGQELLWSAAEAAAGVAPPGEVLAAGDAVCHAQALELLGWAAAGR